MGGQKSGRILVTGALGQIGMELLDALINKFSPENVIATDIRDPEDIAFYLKCNQHHIDAVKQHIHQLQQKLNKH